MSEKDNVAGEEKVKERNLSFGHSMDIKQVNVRREAAEKVEGVMFTVLHEPEDVVIDEKGLSRKYYRYVGETITDSLEALGEYAVLVEKGLRPWSRRFREQ